MIGHPAFQLWVPGIPQPAGSKKAFRHAATGKVIVMDDAKRSRPWKDRVTSLAMEARNGDIGCFHGGLLTGPLELTLNLIMPRPRGHYGTGKNSDRLKPLAPPYPVGKPDSTKLCRAVEDALESVIYKNDSQIVDQHIYKRYGDNPGVMIQVHTITDPED